MWIAQTTPDTWGEFGAFGLALGSLAGFTAWLVRSWVKRESDRGDRLENELREKNHENMKVLTEKAIPALVSVTQMGEKSMEILQKVHDQLERLLEIQRHK